MIGRTLAHFHILEKIGGGGMGVVYRAEDQRLHRPVALKSLRPEVLGNEERRLRFLREARAAAYEDALRHRYSRHYLFSTAAWILDQHRLAGIYERLGDRPRARQWYEKFLADWKDGDPDNPEIVEARKRVQELAGEHGAADSSANRSPG